MCSNQGVVKNSSHVHAPDAVFALRIHRIPFSNDILYQRLHRATFLGQNANCISSSMSSSMWVTNIQSSIMPFLAGDDAGGAFAY